MLTSPDNLRQLHKESIYLQAILHDESYRYALNLVTSPWKLSYAKTDSDHPK